MARIRLVLDSRKKSKSVHTGLYPIVIKIFHKKARMIRLPYSTSISGWDSNNMKLRKSAVVNKDLDCDLINREIGNKLNLARKLVIELGDTLDEISVDTVVENIKKKWDTEIDSELRRNLSNETTVNEWGEVLIKRKNKIKKPSTAKWYRDSITALSKFNGEKPVKFNQITVSFLQEFEAEHLAKGNSKNGISAYLRAIRAIYNSAIKEDVYEPVKNPFASYRIPSTKRNKKKALTKEKILAIRNLQYEFGSNKWHIKNYFLSMFNCRGMNLIDLAKLRVKNIVGDRIHYGRSKTGDPLSVKITEELAEILKYYLLDKSLDDFIFPIGYDGTPENFTKYRSDRRLVNKLLKIIADDAGIEERMTSYYIRHSWATIAKHLGVTTEIISEGLGHSSLRTTEIYLKDFDSEVLDDANDLVVS